MVAVSQCFRGHHHKTQANAALTCCRTHYPGWVAVLGRRGLLVRNAARRQYVFFAGSEQITRNVFYQLCFSSKLTEFYRVFDDEDEIVCSTIVDPIVQFDTAQH